MITNCGRMSIVDLIPNILSALHAFAVTQDRILIVAVNRLDEFSYAQPTFNRFRSFLESLLARVSKLFLYENFVILPTFILAWSAELLYRSCKWKNWRKCHFRVRGRSKNDAVVPRSFNTTNTR